MMQSVHDPATETAKDDEISVADPDLSITKQK
jgi:hypothetical protein